MNKKQLAIQLSKLDTLKNLKVNLEQYQTESELAAELVWKAFMDGNIKNKTVADFGCGNGILGIAALILQAKKVYFVDKDKEAIQTCKKNTQKYINTEFLNLEINNFNKKVDTVLMNPPFGVQNRKADKEFLIKAFETAENIYSMHKIESEKFIEKICEENNFTVLEIMEKEFTIKKIYKFHTKEKHQVKIAVWHLTKNI